jgi:hypothetical protein
MGTVLQMERRRWEYHSRTLASSDEAVKGVGRKLLLEMCLQYGYAQMTPEQVATTKRELRKASQEIEYYQAMQAKYARATRSPWRSVTPDPPIPK